MKTQCPFCSQMYEVDAGDSGKTAECPQCKQNFEITPSEVPQGPQEEKEILPEKVQTEPVANSAKGTHAAKNRLVYCLLAFSIGMLGIHNFYSGHIRRGVIKLLLSILFGWIMLVPITIAIINIIEIFRVKKDAAGTPFADRNPGLANVIGAVSIVLLCLCLFGGIFIIAKLISSSGELREELTKNSCTSNVKQILFFCKHFAEDNADKMPESLNQLEKSKAFKDFTGTQNMFYCGGKNNAGAHSYLLVPGLTSNNSGSMPLVIEKPGGHANSVTIGYVGEYALIHRGNFKRYIDLLPLFKDIKPEEKEMLRERLQKWDAGNFSTEAVNRVRHEDTTNSPYRVQRAFGITFDKDYNFQFEPTFRSSLGYARYSVESPVKGGEHLVAVDLKTHKVLETYLSIPCESKNVATAVMAKFSEKLCADYTLMPAEISEDCVVIYDSPAGHPKRVITLRAGDKSVSIRHSIRPLPTAKPGPECKTIEEGFEVTLGQDTKGLYPHQVSALMKTNDLFQSRLNLVDCGLRLQKVIRILATSITFRNEKELLETVRLLKEAVEKKYNCQMVLSVWKNLQSEYEYRNGDRSITISWMTNFNDMRFDNPNTIDIKYEDEKLFRDEIALSEMEKEQKKKKLKNDTEKIL